MMKRFLSILLAVMMVASLGSFAAFAADETPAEPKLIKELSVADGIDLTGINTYTFTFTAVGLAGSTTATEHPAVSASITVGDQTDDLAKGEKTLASIFEGKTFPHAGVYVYNVTEDTFNVPETEGKTKTLTFDTTTYKLEVYVANKADGGLEITNYIVYEGEEKKDPTKDDADGFKFENTYTEVLDEDENGVLTVTKSITGTYADKTKTFPVSVVLTLPGTASVDNVAVAEGTTWNAETKTASADLADGGKIQFTKLPAGTTFTVKETQDQYYRSKVTGDVETPDTAYSEYGANVDKAGITITASGKNVAIENNRENITPPTGVIINNLPYILLVVIAGGALAFMALKKKAYKA